MTKITRRKFLGSSMTLPLGFGLTANSFLAWSEGLLGKADSIIVGANLLTMDPSQPHAEAMAIAGNRILSIGTNEQIRKFASANTKVIDARGMTVTPGFIDSHSHPLLAMEAIGVNVNLSRIADVKAARARQAAKTPKGHWVRGTMYDDTKFEDGRPLNSKDIDEVVSDHPVFVQHRGGHTAVVNSRAFALAGITIDMPDPKGGKFYRSNGELTGKVAEHATDVFREVGTWPVMDRALWQKSVAISTRNMAASGLTSTTDAFGGFPGFADKHVDLTAYQDARAANELYLRISYMPGGNSDVYKGLKQAGIRSGFGDDMLRIGAVKFGADGSASERTMRMSTPYKDRSDDFGILTMTQEEIDAAVDDAVAHDFRIGIHANGDVTINMVLDAYERVLKNWQGPNPRFRIEHCSLVNPKILKRIKAMGVIPTPFYTYAHFHGNKWPEYGHEKMQWMFAHRSFLDAGIPVAPASDFTPGPYEPMMAIQSMVTRKDVKGRVWGPKQCISVTEALQVCTMNGAYASFEENSKGSLSAGKLADYVILEKDPHEVDPDAIKEIKVLRTVLGGRATHEA
jgi:predicted amidohydrolase YtcJ